VGDAPLPEEELEPLLDDPLEPSLREVPLPPYVPLVPVEEPSEPLEVEPEPDEPVDVEPLEVEPEPEEPFDDEPVEPLEPLDVVVAARWAALAASAGSWPVVRRTKMTPHSATNSATTTATERRRMRRVRRWRWRSRSLASAPAAARRVASGWRGSLGVITGPFGSGSVGSLRRGCPENLKTS
jgi:hypothetical protein